MISDVQLSAVSGIYYIKNLVNGKIYVGSSWRNGGIEGRLRQHLNALRGGYHHSAHLQSSWFKYGESNFEFGILEVVEEAEDLLDRERHWIVSLGTLDHSKGYNKELPPAGVLPRIMSAESREKMSRSGRGRVFSEEHKRKLRAHRHTDEAKERISQARIGKPRSREVVEAVVGAHAKTYLVIDPTGAEQIVVNLAKFCRENGFSVPYMNAVAKGKRGPYKGWKVREIRNGEVVQVEEPSKDKAWLVMDPNGVEQMIVGLRRFCLENGLDPGAMWNVSRGNCSHHKGWKCRKIEAAT